ncbi:type II secretion system protein J [Bdellovibrio sp. HCB337]|uniref:PulJ/GspJ family protein n=1 Tax=Bdellovibrio sp. HCB337 TaxID=3394358 RepID=UPI0039A6F2C7
MRNRWNALAHSDSPEITTRRCFKSSRELWGQQGFSLVELLLGVALISILLYGIGSLMTMASSQSESLSNRIQSEAEVNEMSFYLKHILSMGVNVEYAGNNNINGLSGTGGNSNTGWIRAYDFTTLFNPATTASSVDTIGFFLRDNLASDYVGAPPAVAARFFPTGVFFQRPTPRTYGILYFDLGRPQSAGTVAVSPSLDDLWFGSIVDLKVLEPEINRFDVNFPDTNPAAMTRQRLSSITVKLTVREYLPRDNGPRDFRWCPPTAMTATECRTTTPYKDVERVVRIVFRNNVLGFSTAQMYVSGETPTALRAVRRPLYRRPYDLVYFLRASYPSGQLKRY